MLAVGVNLFFWFNTPCAWVTYATRDSFSWLSMVFLVISSDFALTFVMRLSQQAIQSMAGRWKERYLDKKEMRVKSFGESLYSEPLWNVVSKWGTKSWDKDFEGCKLCFRHRAPTGPKTPQLVETRRVRSVDGGPQVLANRWPTASR